MVIYKNPQYKNQFPDLVKKNYAKETQIFINGV